MVSRPSNQTNQEWFPFEGTGSEDLTFDDYGDKCYLIAQGTHHIRAAGPGDITMETKMKWECICIPETGNPGDFLSPQMPPGTWYNRQFLPLPGNSNPSMDADRKGLKSKIYYIASKGRCNKTRIDGTPGPPLCTESGEIDKTILKTGMEWYIDAVRSEWEASFDLKGRDKEEAQRLARRNALMMMRPSAVDTGIIRLKCSAGVNTTT